MTLAEMLLQARTKRGWSQGDLADRLGVTKEMIARWESEEGNIDFEDINTATRLMGFGDMDKKIADLLKNSPKNFAGSLQENFAESSPEKFAESSIKNSPETQVKNQHEHILAMGLNKKFVSMDEANQFIDLKKRVSSWIALASVLSFISPIPLLAMVFFGEKFGLEFLDRASYIYPLVFCLMLDNFAILLFIFASKKTRIYKFLGRECFQTEYTVKSMVEDKRNSYEDVHRRKNIIASIFLIVGIMAIVIPSFFIKIGGSNLIFLIAFVVLALGISVFIFIKNSIIWSSFFILLEEGCYRPERKSRY